MTETIDRVAKTSAPSRFRPGQFALRDTWFPIAHSYEVGKRRPVRRVLHGAPVILWRDGERIHAAEDWPGTPVAQRRQSELLDGTGEYATHERYGYVWVWYGSPRGAPIDLIPHIPLIPIDGMPRWFTGSVIFDCSSELLVENLLDLTHADFLHSKLTGDSLSDDDVIDVESTSETVTMIRTAHGRPIPAMQRAAVRGAKTQNIRLVTVAFVRSGLTVLHGDFNPGMSIRMFQPITPETSTRSRTLVSYNPAHVPQAARLMFPRVTRMVARQDNWALRKQNPEYVGQGMNDGDRDLSSRFDKAGLRYRKVYSELVARQQAGDFSYLADGDTGRDLTEELGLNSRP